MAISHKMSDVAAKEMEWYLRDHLFRQSNTGKSAFRRESLPNDMATLYLRYKGADVEQLSQLADDLARIGRLGAIVKRHDRVFECARAIDQALDAQRRQSGVAIANGAQIALHLVGQELATSILDHAGESLERVIPAKQLLDHRIVRAGADGPVEGQQRLAD